MLEKNKHILQDLLRKLPDFPPPPHVWDGIEKSISSPSHHAGLDKLLPLYNPPDSVWSQIELSLDPAATAPRKAIIRLMPWLTAAAASFAVFMWFLQPGAIKGASNEVISFSYAREIVDDALLARDWQQDEEAFQMAERLCATSTFACSNPDVNTLRTELDELTEAKTALESALGKYGTDPDLIGQLAEIERQRTTILKKMLEYFI